MTVPLRGGVTVPLRGGVTQIQLEAAVGVFESPQVLDAWANPVPRVT